MAVTPLRLRAFTLLEVLIAVALTVLVIGLLMIPLTGSVGYFRSATARADAHSVARTTMDTMARELAEAAYVRQDMADTGAIAFAPPLRVDPNDPTSQVVTPPRPDWNHMVRYWRALRDPAQNYNPTRRVGAANTFYVARTVVDNPFDTEDVWNEWNATWAANMNSDPSQKDIHWAPITRVVHTDYDWHGLNTSGEPIWGARNQTAQPGYPYLAATWDYANDAGKKNRFYRDRVQPLTPNAEDYDISALSFEPLVVSGEWLTPALGRDNADKSVYLARYPLWRLGVPYTSWTALPTGDPNNPGDPFISRIFYEQQVRGWQPRDPFLLIYRYGVAAEKYALVGVGAFDSRSRTLKILNPTDAPEWLIYDTYSYPVRSQGALLGLDVDWVNGSVRFDFPPLQRNTTTGIMETAERPVPITGADLRLPTDWPSTSSAVYDYPLASWWYDRKDAPNAAALDHFLLPESVSVKLNTQVNGKDLPGLALTRVTRTPRDYTNEYQVGMNATAGGPPDPPGLIYGYLRLPAHLASGVSTKAVTTKLWVYYRWRSNGIVKASGQLESEKPDLVCAYYRTGAIVDINLTVNRADPSKTTERISQSATVTRRVKLRTAVRDVRQIK